MEADHAHYDEINTMFSPEGRLLQVEYALKAVNRGSSITSLKYDKGVLLLAIKPQHSPLLETNSQEKIFQLDHHIACTVSGIMADAYFLVEQARIDAQQYYFQYGEAISVKELVDSISSYIHLFTQFEGVRPFGTTMIMAGVDDKGKQLFATDPSGVFIGYKAFCAGNHKETVHQFLLDNHVDDLSFKDGVKLGVQALQKTIKKPLPHFVIDVARIDYQHAYYHLSLKELEKILK